MIFRRLLLSISGPQFCAEKFVKAVSLPLKIFQIIEKGESYLSRGRPHVAEFAEVTFMVSSGKEEVVVAGMKYNLGILVDRLEEFNGTQIVVNYQIFTDENEIETTVLEASFLHLFSSANVFFSTELFRHHVSEIKKMNEELNESS